MAVVTVSAKLLENAAKRNCFALPETGLIFFGIRGALPESVNNQNFADKHDVRFTDIDHVRMRCTIGQWNRSEGTIAIYPGSTVPSLGSIAAAKSRGGAGANLLIPGRYEYVKGVHKAGKPGGHRAFRQGCFLPVRRTKDNTSFDNFDKIDFGSGSGDFVWDNIHSAYYDEPDSAFSSAGCQVVRGLPASPARGNAKETGAWRAFTDTAYGTFATQDRFVYLLFTADEIASLAVDDTSKIQQVVRYGSSGALPKQVQGSLENSGDYAGDIDGNFGRRSVMALTAFQEKKFGPAIVDGVCGANTALALGITLPTLKNAKTASGVLLAPDQSTVGEIDLIDETDMSLDELRALLAKFGLGSKGTAGIGATEARSSEQDRTLSLPGFFDAVRQALFDGMLRDSQVNGIKAVIDVWTKSYPSGNPRWLAYILASVYHETGRRMIPVREGFKDTDEKAREHVRNMFLSGRINHDYAIPVDGISYFGRGRIQVTHLANYQKLMRRFNRDFVREPNLLLDSSIDAEVAVIGHVEGLWTRFKLADFISGLRCDYVGARQIVNGHDRAGDIANYASKFERAVRASLTSAPVAITSPVPSPAPTPNLPSGEIQVGEKPMSTADEEIKSRMDRIEAALAALLNQSPSPTPIASPAPVPDSGPSDETNTERLKAIKEFIEKFSQVSPTLTPVNAALGETIGKLVDGRKSAIGIVGSVLTSIIGQSSDGSVLGKLVGAVTSTVPALSGLSGPMLPIFLAIAAWGVLGKGEKWTFLKKK